ERALRPLENLDALQVRGIDVEIAARQLSGLIVQIDRDIRKAVDGPTRLGSLVADTQAAHEDLRLTWPGGGARDVGQISHRVVEVRDIQLLQRLAGKRLDGDRHILRVLAAPLRGDNDFLQTAAGSGRLISRRSGMDRGGCVGPENCGDCAGALGVDMHRPSLPLWLFRRLRCNHCTTRYTAPAYGGFHSSK